MGFSSSYSDGFEPETAMLMNPSGEIPKDKFHLGYIIYFTLGAGYLLPWNAFITAVDYFSYLYPDASVDRVFAVTYMLVGPFFLLFVIGSAHKSRAYWRINVGLALFMVSLLVVPVIDLVYVKGRTGLYSGYYVTIAALVLSGIADALVQGSVIGSAGELPNRYLQATVAGTAASGVLVSLMRIITKSIYPQNPHGLRSSANLYFAVSIVFMAICIGFYNVADKLPIIQYYKDLKTQVVTSENMESIEKGAETGSLWRASLWDTLGRIKWLGSGILLIYTVTLSIFPGYITEDVHSRFLKDWYSIILIAGYNVFDLVGKSLTAIYVLKNSKIAVAGSVARLLFYPLFLGCLHGPKFFRTEIPVTLLTCLLGLTNGYLTSVLMILAPKSVPLQHAETAGILIVLFLVVGLAAGSIVAWFWVI